MRYDIAALKSRLGPIRTEDNPALVRQKSRTSTGTPRPSRSGWST
jgi:hypothetical protein